MGFDTLVPQISYHNKYADMPTLHPSSHEFQGPRAIRKILMKGYYIIDSKPVSKSTFRVDRTKKNERR